jgi:thiosulfate/3-mercaptopyruvate sulfurtransferase
MSRGLKSVRGRGVVMPARARNRLLRGALLLALAVGAILPGVAALASPWPPWSNAGQAPEPTYPDVTTGATWLAAHLGDRGLVVIDGRSRASYLAGHIPTAVSIPSRSVPAGPEATDAFAKSGVSGRERIVCYGDASYSPDAGRLFWLLELAGAEHVSLLDGGVVGWTGSGNTLVQNEISLPAGAWKVSPRIERLATRDRVTQKFGEPDVEIVDTRGWAEWEGPISDPETRGSVWRVRGREGGSAPRVGHIPHALPFDFHRFLRADGAFKSPQETRAIFAELGPRPSSPVDLSDEFILYDDGSSGEGALGYSLLRRAGLGALSYYPGGWAEWASDPTLPVVRIVHAQELKERLASARRWFKPDAPPPGFAFFDVRHEGDYARAHIPGAVCLTSRYFLDSLDVFIERYWPGLDRRTAPIVVYCYGPDCIRSRNCTTWAARKGFLNAERFYGGMDEWRAAGGRLITAE